MFNNLRNTILNLNADVNNVANCEKARKLRKKLLAIGLTLAIAGIVLSFVCIVMFALGAAKNVGEVSFNIVPVLVPALLLLPCGLMASIGLILTVLALKIVVTGYATGVVKETIGNNCPNCNTAIKNGELYCPKCGTRFSKKCEACGFENDSKNEFCSQCGKSLK